MKLILAIMISLMTFSFCSYATQCASASRILLDDLVFQYDSKMLRANFRNPSKHIGIKTRLKEVKRSEAWITAAIELVNSSDEVCRKIEFQVPPVKLCKKADGSYEPWRFVACPDSPHCWTQAAQELPDSESISVISVAATTDEAKMSNVKICGKTKITSPQGHVFISDSYLGPEL